MFRVRKLTGDSPQEVEAIEEAKAVLRGQFPGIPDEDLSGLAERLSGAWPGRFRTHLLVGERTWKGRLRVEGCALVLHDAESRFCWLDYLAADKAFSGRGIGGALYAEVRSLARSLGCVGLFFECQPDVLGPGQTLEAAQLRQNAARLKFYERFGARPLADNAWNRPPPRFAASAVMPLIVWDGLDQPEPLSREAARRMARVVLEGKYRRICPPDYVDAVVDSFAADPVPTRPPRYGRQAAPGVARRGAPAESVLVVHDEGHRIHHVRERGYVEAPARVEVILDALRGVPGFELCPPVAADVESALRGVHDPALVEFLRRACETAAETACVYPYVFPVRNRGREPRDLLYGAGYYCIDTFTPITRDAYPAAVAAARCALTAADAILSGRRLAYGLVRPPGHHAERRVYGGFCYFNNAALAAQRLLALGPRVAILDVDYHHGNGQQEIFYDRSDVLTVSIHGDPVFAYPFFSGFADETGEGVGAGFNVNLPLPEEVDGERYLQVLDGALARIRDFAPSALVVALGLDTARKDPTGTWSLVARDFHAVGARIEGLGLPTVVVQEGGYRTRTLATNARRFLDGLRGEP